jgi:hypothetical protein
VQIRVGEASRILLGNDLLARLGRELVELGCEARVGCEDGRAIGHRVHDMHNVLGVAGRAVLFQQRRDGAACRVDVFGL